MTFGYESFAISWVPAPNEPLADFGRRWTGWCPDRGEKQTRMRSPACGLDLRPLTHGTSRYGLQGVICPAFRPRHPHSLWIVERALNEVADEAREIVVPGLELGIVGGRVALVPVTPHPALGDLVLRVREAMRPHHGEPAVQASFEDGGEEIAARMGLSFRRAAQFHLPLTDAMPPETACRIAVRLRGLVAPLLSRMFRISDLAIVADPGNGRRVSVHDRYGLSDRSRGLSETFACRGPRTLVPCEREMAAAAL